VNRFRLLGVIVVASFAGVLGSELLCRSVVFRDAAGRLSGRGRLIAIASGRGLYQKDFDGQEISAVSDQVSAENLRHAARNEQPDPAKMDREFSLLRAQFGDEGSFLQRLRSSGLSIPSLRERIADQLRSRQWLEKQIKEEAPAIEKECRNFYETHRGFFAEPVRFRASHVFLAAPADTPPEVVESKRARIDALAVRLARGESLSQLAAEASEDEATKLRGGDLGFFCAARMPAEFFSEIEKLPVGHASRPFRSHLGFHIAKVTEIRPARVLSFDEVRGDIVLVLANERRALIAKRLAEMLDASACASPY
jgi:hypothetical protein